MCVIFSDRGMTFVADVVYVLRINLKGNSSKSELDIAVILRSFVMHILTINRY